MGKPNPLNSSGGGFHRGRRKDTRKGLVSSTSSRRNTCKKRKTVRGCRHCRRCRKHITRKISGGGSGEMYVVVKYNDNEKPNDFKFEIDRVEYPGGSVNWRKKGNSIALYRDLVGKLKGVSGVSANMPKPTYTPGGPSSGPGMGAQSNSYGNTANNGYNGYNVNNVKQSDYNRNITYVEKNPDNTLPSKKFCETGVLEENEKFNQNIHNLGKKPKEICSKYYSQYDNNNNNNNNNLTNTNANINNDDISNTIISENPITNITQNNEKREVLVDNTSDVSNLNSQSTLQKIMERIHNFNIMSVLNKINIGKNIKNEIVQNIKSIKNKLDLIKFLKTKFKKDKVKNNDIKKIVNSNILNNQNNGNFKGDTVIWFVPKLNKFDYGIIANYVIIKNANKDVVKGVNNTTVDAKNAIENNTIVVTDAEKTDTKKIVNIKNYLQVIVPTTLISGGFEIIKNNLTNLINTSQNTVYNNSKNISQILNDIRLKILNNIGNNNIISDNTSDNTSIAPIDTTATENFKENFKLAMALKMFDDDEDD